LGDMGWDHANNKPIEDPEEIEAIRETNRKLDARGTLLDQIRDCVGQAHPRRKAAASPTTPSMSRKLSLMEPRIHGDDVLAVQKRLLSLNFSEVGATDGWFGPMTEDAVKKFQRCCRIKDDGAVGPDTWSVLFSPDPILVGFRADLSVMIGYTLESLGRREGELSSGPSVHGKVTWYIDEKGLL
jgi:hypothetical protein